MQTKTNSSNIDLCGTWSFAFSETAIDSEIRSAADIVRAGLPIFPCTVPGNFELDLQSVGLADDPFFGMNIVELRRYEHAHVWYFRTFEAARLPEHQAELHFEGVDCFADFYLNGQFFGSSDNMLIPHTFPIQDYLQDSPTSFELLVHLRPTVEEALQFDYPPSVSASQGNFDSLYIRKAPHMFGWDIMPRALSAGLWRPITLRYRPVVRFDDVTLRTASVADDHTSARLQLHYKARVGDFVRDRYEVDVEARCGDSTFQKCERVLSSAGRVHIHVSDVVLWWPKGRGPANLYEVTVRLLMNGVVADSQSFQFGIRTVELIRTGTTDTAGSGEFCFRVNGEKVFVLGTNWVPADAYHSRDLSRIPQMFALLLDIGCNLVRCWGGNVYEDDLFYNLCDKNGIIVWQDFAMACAVYPQDARFREVIAHEATAIVERLRNHACIVLWAGDNECDLAYGWHDLGDPNCNALTRQVLPDVLRVSDPLRPYLPSSPVVDSEAYHAGESGAPENDVCRSLNLYCTKGPLRESTLPENHLWGPRDYYKSDFYQKSLCHLVSEIGYHGCLSEESIRRFMPSDEVWPNENNPQWLLRATSPIPGINLHDYRIALMTKQIAYLFGRVPDQLDEYAYASQASQAEALKFFIELFRAAKWRRTGIIWWNLIDGWPQFSDAVVDYYFTKKLAYSAIKDAQRPVILMLREPSDLQQELVACNDSPHDVALEYEVTDVDNGAVLAKGIAAACADCVTSLCSIACPSPSARFIAIAWTIGGDRYDSHYLGGNPPFDLEWYRKCMAKVN